MLRLDRRQLTRLPRPIYEIQAEWIPSIGLRLTVMVGQGGFSRTEEFPALATVPLSQRLSDWLWTLPYVAHPNAEWECLTREVGAHVAHWALEELIVSSPR